MVFILPAVQSSKVDSVAMAILKKNRDAMFALRGYRARCQLVSKSLNPEPGRAPVSFQFSVLTAAKPNLISYQMWETKGPKSAVEKPAGAPDFAVASNGKKTWTQSHKSYFISETADPHTFETVMEPWDGFYVPDRTYFEQMRSHLEKKDDVVVRSLGREKVDGALCDKVEIDLSEQHGGKSRKSRTIVFFRPDGLVRRQLTTETSGKAVFITSCNLLHIEKNPDLRRQSYAYTPPKGSTPFKAPEGGPEATSHESLLANGTSAPDFVAKDKGGKEIKLSDLKGKVVILDFWASWCAPCVASMPHTQSVADKLQKEGLPVVVMAVDDAEKLEAFAVWVKKMGATYPAINFVYSPQKALVAGKLFKVTGIPTQYIIDSTGTIRATFIGYGGETEALEKAVRTALKGG